MKRKVIAIALAAMTLMSCAVMQSCRKSGFDSDKSISVVAREDGSGTKSAFMEIIGLKGKSDVSGVIIATGTAGVLAEMKSNPLAIAYESLRSVPVSYREGAYALGAGKARMVFSVVLPAASGGIVTAVISGSGSVKAEKEHLTELIKNLAENGIRYNHSGGAVRITVSAAEKGTAISVADDGIGIDVEHQSRIFERFYRVSKSRSRETGGTGLGLAIVKHICSLYSAEISLRSKPGVVTEITVSFPQKNKNTACGFFENRRRYIYILYCPLRHQNTQRSRAALSQIYSLLATRPRSSFHSVFPSQRSSAKSAAGSHMCPSKRLSSRSPESFAPPPVAFASIRNISQAR